MKVCFISPYPPKKGGISTYTKRVVNCLIDNKIDAKIIPFNNPSAIRNIYSELKKNKPDIVRLEFALSIYGIHIILVLAILTIFKIKNRTKIIANFHETKREIDFLGALGKIYYNLISKLFDRIYVHTNEAREILNLKCKVEKSKIKVIPHGTYKFENKRNFDKEIIQKFGLKRKKIILYFGYIHVDKGIQYLLKASEILSRTTPGFINNSIVLIAGSVRPRVGIFKIFERKDKLYLKNLIDLKNKLGLDKFVKFVGFIEDKYVYSLLKLAKVVVLPYTDVEQSGVLNLALAAHKPVVASNIGGLKETLKASGVLVQPKNPQEIARAVLWLIKDKKYYADLVNQYKRIDLSQNTEQVTKEIIKDYKDLIKA